MSATYKPPVSATQMIQGSNRRGCRCRSAAAASRPSSGIRQLPRQTIRATGFRSGTVRSTLSAATSVTSIATGRRCVRSGESLWGGNDLTEVRILDLLIQSAQTPPEGATAADRS